MFSIFVEVMKFYRYATQIIFCTILLCSTSQAQSRWEWQNRLPQGSTLRDVYRFSEERFIAVGDHGTIVVTTDRGNHWSCSVYTMGIEDNFTGIDFVNDSLGFIVSWDGSILRTKDGGINWSSVLKMTDTYFTDVCVQSPTRIIVGSMGAIYQSSDSGSTWSRMVLGNSLIGMIRAIKFLNENVGAMVSGEYWGMEVGSVLITQDGGASWQLQNQSYYGMLDVEFVTDSILIAVGYDGDIRRSIDLGMNWENIGQYQMWSSAHLRSVAFVDSLNGLAVGDGGMFMTLDGGKSWKARDDTPSGSYYCLRMIDRRGIICGAGGIILRTGNGGLTWDDLTTGPTNNIQSVDFIDSKNGVVVGDRGLVLWTTNAGVKWLEGQSNQTDALYEVHMLSQSNALALNDRGSILRSTNGGMQWEAITTAFRDTLHAMDFIDEQQGIIVGDGGFFCITTDDGDTWSVDSIAGAKELIAVCFIDSMRIVAFEQSQTWFSSDGGSSWTKGAVGPVYNSASVSRVGGIVYCLSWLDDLSSSIDGGRTWKKKKLPQAFVGNGIHFITEAHGIAFDLGGKVIETKDSGTTWNNLKSPTTNTLRSCVALSSGSVFFVGHHGTILRYSPESPSSVDQSQTKSPSHIRLFQNYPNPFSASTSITFELTSFRDQPSPSKIKLQVFDTFGRNVDLLVDDNFDSGVHTIHWDALGLPDGVYLYRLDDGTNSLTKTAIVIR